MERRVVDTLVATTPAVQRVTSGIDTALTALDTSNRAAHDGIAVLTPFGLEIDEDTTCPTVERVAE